MSPAAFFDFAIFFSLLQLAELNNDSVCTWVLMDYYYYCLVLPSPALCAEILVVVVLTQCKRMMNSRLILEWIAGDLTLIFHLRFGGSTAAPGRRRASISVKLSTSHTSSDTLLFSSYSPVFSSYPFCVSSSAELQHFISFHHLRQQ